jgi:hypothetical protein
MPEEEEVEEEEEGAFSCCHVIRTYGRNGVIYTHNFTSYRFVVNCDSRVLSCSHTSDSAILGHISTKMYSNDACQHIVVRSQQQRQ